MEILYTIKLQSQIRMERMMFEASGSGVVVKSCWKCQNWICSSYDALGYVVQVSQRFNLKIKPDEL